MPDADDRPEVREALEEAQRFLREGRPRRALDALADLRAVTPDHPELTRLERETREAIDALDARSRVRPLVDRARKLAVQGNVTAALGVAEEAVAAAPNDARALRLRDELAGRLREANAAAPARAPSPATRPVAPAAAAPPVSPAPSAPARPRVDPAAERARRVEVLRADARRMLEAGRYQACLGLLAQLVTLAPDHPDAAELRMQAEAQQRAAEGRLERIRAALAEGRAALVAGDGPLALDRFTSVLADDPGQAEARRGLAEARARVAHRERVDTLIAAARGRLERDEVEAAERDVREALRLEPRDPEGLDLEDRIWLRGRELRAARVRAAPAVERVRAPTPPPPAVPAAPPEASRLEPAPAPSAPAPRVESEAPAALEVGPAAPALDAAALADEAARLIGDGRPDRALDVLARLRAAAPQHQEVARLEAQAQRAAQAREVRSRVRALLDRARRLSLQGELDSALAAAEEAVRAAPDDARALRLRDELQDRLRPPGDRGTPSR